MAVERISEGDLISAIEGGVMALQQVTVVMSRQPVTQKLSFTPFFRLVSGPQVYGVELYGRRGLRSYANPINLILKVETDYGFRGPMHFVWDDDAEAEGLLRSD